MTLNTVLMSPVLGLTCI